MREEIGLAVPPGALGPLVARTSGYADLGWAEGVFEDNFFHYRVTSLEVDISGQEAHESAHHGGHRWWSPAALAARTDTVYPLGLASLVEELTAGRVPLRPVSLPWQH
ncbi:hypothetical protein [Streptomyces sp. NPDC088725]|uniref:hypothetical protein n=1 Tax=Streptomyces sp. NPDC088725 TaxID=3365873 RepID=UPI003816D853